MSAVYVDTLDTDKFTLNKFSGWHTADTNADWIRAVPKDVRAAITRINDVRNDLARSFFPRNRRRYIGVKKVVYDGVHLFTKEGVTRFGEDFDLAYKYLTKRAFRVT